MSDHQELTDRGGVRKWIFPVFITVAGLCIIITLISIHRDPRGAYHSMFFRDFYDRYMDFFHSIEDNRTLDVYTARHVIYPPLINLGYHLVGKLLPEQGAWDLVVNHRAVVIYYVLQISCALLYVFAVWLNTSGMKMWKRVLVAAVSAVSMPLLYTVERGNCILLAAALVLLFVHFHDSSKPVLKYLGFLALAVAANIKIWPALFGLILGREKRWKDAVICLLMGIVLFVIPSLFYNGLDTPRIILENFAGAANSQNVLGIGYKIGWANFFRIIERTFNCEVDEALLVNIMGALVIICSLIARSRYACFLGITLICTAFPEISNNYNCLYLFIPICLLLTSPKPDIADLVTLVLLTLAISPLGINLEQSFQLLVRNGEPYVLDLSTYVQCWTVWLAAILFIAHTVYDCIRQKKISIFFPVTEVAA